MTKNNVVAITAHPKFRSVAALRAYLEGNQEDFGTKITLEDFNSNDPAVQQMLADLNDWCVGLQNLNTVADRCEQMFKGGLRRGEFSMISALPRRDRYPIIVHNEIKYKRYEAPKDDA